MKTQMTQTTEMKASKHGPWRSLAVATAATAGLLMAPGTSLAASGHTDNAAHTIAAATGRSDACGSRGCGSVTVTWGAKKLTQVSMSVRDTKCDGKQVGVQLQVLGVSGQTWGGPVHWNRYDHACGKPADAWYNLHFEASWKIRAINAVVYVKNGSHGPILYPGNSADNPYT
ncbi:hypothetical protein ACFV2X_02600 [Streptomyces sp. NPDC059679]|uniref:hypothetical protein n=1 Tax=Streptomyces sp. NPDC059679 TaxID=3346903 RepID=UPI0036CB75B3